MPRTAFATTLDDSPASARGGDQPPSFTRAGLDLGGPLPKDATCSVCGQEADSLIRAKNCAGKRVIRCGKHFGEWLKLHASCPQCWKGSRGVRA